jgi:hypothetical protein
LVWILRQSMMKRSEKEPGYNNVHDQGSEGRAGSLARATAKLYASTINIAPRRLLKSGCMQSLYLLRHMGCQICSGALGASYLFKRRGTGVNNTVTQMFQTPNPLWVRGYIVRAEP